MNGAQLEEDDIQEALLMRPGIGRNLGTTWLCSAVLCY